MAERVDLEHAEREANSLKRYGDVNGFEDLADFAALTLALAAECKAGRRFREDIAAALAPGRWRGFDGPDGVDVLEVIEDVAQALMRYDQATGRPDPAAGHADDADDTEAEVGKQVFGA